MAEQTQQLTGTITGYNGKGLQVDGGWINYSRSYKGDRDNPPVSKGQTVTLEVVPWNEIKLLQRIISPGGGGGNGSPSTAPSGGGQQSYAAPAAPPIPQSERLSCVALQAAAAYMASQPTAATADVREVAEEFLGWLNRACNPVVEAYRETSQEGLAF